MCFVHCRKKICKYPVFFIRLEIRVQFYQWNNSYRVSGGSGPEWKFTQHEFILPLLSAES